MILLIFKREDNDMIKAEVKVDKQNGPIVTVNYGDTVVSIYLIDETAVVTTYEGMQYGLEVTGQWKEFKTAMDKVIM